MALNTVFDSTRALEPRLPRSVGPDALEHQFVVDRHPRPARLVRVANRGFFEVLHRKLGWGER